MKILDTNLDLLRSFTCFVESPNMLAAAAKLGISQPLLTKHLQQLEEAAGVPLFYIEGRKKLPTRYGQELFRLVKGGLEDLQQRIQSLEFSHGDGSEAVVRIGGRREILELVSERLEFKGRVEFFPMTGREVMRALLDRKLEVGITQYDVNSFNFVQKKFFNDQFSLIYPGSWSIEGESLKGALNSLLKKPYISYGESDPIAHVAAHFGIAQLPVPSRAFPNWPTVVKMVKRRIGWSVVPGLFLDESVAKISVPEKILPVTAFKLIYPKEYSQVSWFRDLVEAVRHRDT